MTTVLDRPAALPVSFRPAVRWAAGVPWLLVLAALAGALLLTDVSPAASATYAGYVVLGVVLPGTLVHRALRGSRGNLAEDLGLGAATGLVVQLAGWALAAATGSQRVLWCWPLLVLVAFAIIPALRKHWRVTGSDPLPLRWHWAICGVLLFVIAWAAVNWIAIPVPPADASYYPDLMYHLALVHEMTRSMPFEVPQLAGDTLRYHYLSDADMAAASMITGLPAELVLTRLWMVPIGAAGALVIALLAREVSGRWWTGPLAAGVALVGTPLALGGTVPVFGTGPLVFASPSQTYAVPLLGLLTLVAIDVLRGRRLGPAWFFVPLLALACAGAKSSALPPLVAGAGLGAVALWVRDRRFPRTAAGFLIGVLIPMAVGTRLFAGGGAGTLGVQPLSVLRWMLPYSETLGRADGVSAGGLLPPGLQSASGGAWLFVVWIIAWWLLMESPRLLGLAGFADRKDPVNWLLGGMTVAGLAAMWLLWHPSASQLYFFLCALPVGVVLSTWFLAARVRRWWVPAAGLVAGAVWAVVAPVVARPATLPPLVPAVRPDNVPLIPPGSLPEDPGAWSGWSWAMATPVLWAAGFVLAGAVVVLVLRRSFRSLVVAVVAAILGASLGQGVEFYARTLADSGFGTHAAAPLPVARTVFREEMNAALWLSRNSDKTDVVATNVHCMPMNRYRPCDARAFWVAGLTGRRILVESWAYSDKTVAANGVDDLKYVLQPAPDPAKFDLNQRAFTTPTPADLHTLATEHHVKWLFADLRAGAVSPELAKLARIRWTEGPVTIYEL